MLVRESRGGAGCEPGRMPNYQRTRTPVSHNRRLVAVDSAGNVRGVS